MKILKVLSALAVSATMVFSVAALNVSAATTAQDGLEVSLTTDKEVYNKDEKITASLSVKNTNEVDITDIAMETIIPDGYEIADGTKNDKQLDKLAPNESAELKVVYVAKDSGEDSQDSEISQGSQESQNSEVSTVSSSNDSPRTGDNAIIPVAIALVMFVSALLLLLCFKSKKGRKLLSVILTVSIVGGSSALISLKTNAVNENTKTINVNTIINADNRKVKVSAKISYNIASSETKELCIVTFDTNGGSKVDEQIVKKGTQITVPKDPVLNGYVFAGWYTSIDFNEEYNFVDNIVYEDILLYARWVNIEDKTDSDKDGLSDAIEEYLKTDPHKTDTDGDGLSDYFEVMLTGTDPLKIDTDENGINDAEEDLDQDGLSNLQESVYMTDPGESDTDHDKLTDLLEITKYKTDPLKYDTDEDGVSDGNEIELSTDPLKPETEFKVEKSLSSDTDDTVTPSVKVNLSGNQVETLTINRINNTALFSEDIPGYLGGAYSFNVEGSFESAEIGFQFDENLNTKDDFDPVIYYFNEENHILEPLPTIVKNSVAYATVEHFSTYVLIDRSIFENAFVWTDVWDSDSEYSSVQIVFVIDDSGSMGIQGSNNDPYNDRLTVAKELIEKLPSSSEIGIIAFDSQSINLTNGLVNDKDTAKSYLTTEYFKSDGHYTYMYDGIKMGLELLNNDDENILKIMIILSDGAADDDELHSSVVSQAQNNSVKLFTVGLGTNEEVQEYFDSTLRPLSSETGGIFYLANNASQLSEIYKDIGNKIDIETDSDKDGIPDYYEEHLVGFNGINITLNKNNKDTDGDGLSDGEEVTLDYHRSEDGTKVCVIGKIHSNPSKKDSDNDGFDDKLDPTPLDPVCYKSFDAYQEAIFGDKATLTVFVDQPYINSRSVINFDDTNEYVGHTYVGIDYGDTEEYAGFWPYVTDKNGHAEGYGTMRAIFRKSVNGMIRMIGGVYITDGKNDNVFEEVDYNEKDHKWDIARTFSINTSDVGKLKKYSQDYKQKYNMVSNNCTTFAINALNHFGLSPNISAHRWTYGDGMLNWLAGTYYGFSPADAGQDIRDNYDDYIYWEDCKLKDGTTVKAVYDNSYKGLNAVHSGGGISW